MAAKRARVVLRTPADAVEANLEAQRAQRDKMKELQRQHEAAMEAARREMAELKRREAELRGRASLAPIAINDLPEPALRAILLGPSDNLLRFVAACARVCAEWRRVVGGSAAYGLGLPRGQREDLPSHIEYEGEDDERARVLKAITEVLERGGKMLHLEKQIGDAGAAALGAALQAMPRIRFTLLNIDRNGLTAAGVTSIVPALRRPWGDGGLKVLHVGSNPLGDAGVVALAKALPPTLEQLVVNLTGCGDDGLLALAAALPALNRLRSLFLYENPAATARGWVALAGAMPSLPALVQVSIMDNPGIGSEGAAALAAAVPNCAQLRYVYVYGCELGLADQAALQAVSAADRCLIVVHYSDSEESDDEDG